MKLGGTCFFQTVVFDQWQDCSIDFLRPVYHTILYSRRSLELLCPPQARLLPTLPGAFGCDIVAITRTN